MEISAALIKELRQETDAPLLDIRSALVEASGDKDRAKQILREKGRAAAASRSERETSAGVVSIVRSPDGESVGVVVLESETDFVSSNGSFIEAAEAIAKALLANPDASDPMEVATPEGTVRTIVEDAVNKFRENIRLSTAKRISGEGKIAFYVHHTKNKGAIVRLKGSAPNLLDIGYKLAVQTVASPPEFVRKEDVPAEIIEREVQTEVQRALNEGKDETIARNVAQGRVNKEFLQARVLLEQPFYADLSKPVKQYVAEETKEGDVEVLGFELLTTGGK